jgi:thiamine-phosphate pyrophosphorylase
VIRYQITDGSANLDEAAWFARLRKDVDFIQIREPALNSRQLAKIVRAAIPLGPAILVNDRADVAIACGAAGVHLRSGTIFPSRIRIIAPAGFVISLACHTAEDIKQAEGADYIVLAPIFQPLSKSPDRQPMGLQTLREIAAKCPLPIIALGGITESNLIPCREAGAKGVAGITLFAHSHTEPRQSGSGPRS